MRLNSVVIKRLKEIHDQHLFQHPCDLHSDTNCYCPAIGKCEVYRYQVWQPITRLDALKEGSVDETSLFYLKVEVTNNALLSSTKVFQFSVEFTVSKCVVRFAHTCKIT